MDKYKINTSLIPVFLHTMCYNYATPDHFVHFVKYNIENHDPTLMVIFDSFAPFVNQIYTFLLNYTVFFPQFRQVY